MISPLDILHDYETQQTMLKNAEPPASEQNLTEDGIRSIKFAGYLGPEKKYTFVATSLLGQSLEKVNWLEEQQTEPAHVKNRGTVPSSTATATSSKMQLNEKHQIVPVYTAGDAGKVRGKSYASLSSVALPSNVEERQPLPAYAAVENNRRSSVSHSIGTSSSSNGHFSKKHSAGTGSVKHVDGDAISMSGVQAGCLPFFSKIRPKLSSIAQSARSTLSNIFRTPTSTTTVSILAQWRVLNMMKRLVRLSMAFRPQRRACSCLIFDSMRFSRRKYCKKCM